MTRARTRRAAAVLALGAGLAGSVAGVPAAAAAFGDDPAARPVTEITDPRVAESSALVLDRDDPGLAYTINDSDNTPAVYVVDLASGDVVGVTTLTGYDLRDTEALAYGPDGRLLVADVGDNDEVRRDVALYAIDPPSTGDAEVTPERYPVSYPDGPHDAETLLVDPDDGEVSIVTKGFLEGAVYSLGTDLVADEDNRATKVAGARPALLATDGVFLPDGSRVVVRTYIGVLQYDPDTWEQLAEQTGPRQPQGESVAVEPDGRTVLLGTEGSPSPVVSLRLVDPAPADGPGAGPSGTPSPSAPATSVAPEEPSTDASTDATGVDADQRPTLAAVGGGVALVVVLMAAGVALRRRRGAGARPRGPRTG